MGSELEIFVFFIFIFYTSDPSPVVRCFSLFIMRYINDTGSSF